MSMLNLHRPRAGRAAPAAAPADTDRPAVAGVPMRMAPPHEAFADEAKRAAQRYIDVVDDNAALRAEVERWRGRAIVAEEAIVRLKADVAEAQATIERKIEAHAAERDHTRQTIAVLQASYTNAAKILLDGFALLEGFADVKARIDLPAMAKAIAEPTTTTITPDTEEDQHGETHDGGADDAT